MARWPDRSIPYTRTQTYSSLVSMLKYFSQGTMSLGTLGAAWVNSTWPNANEALYIPIEVEYACQVQKFWVANGGTASGNIDIGLYSEDGTRLINMGSTAQSGTNVIQTFDTTDIIIGRGVFYLAVVANSTLTTMFANTGGLTNDWKANGMLLQATALPLPATATFATNIRTFCPLAGFTARLV